MRLMLLLSPTTMTPAQRLFRCWCGAVDTTPSTVHVPKNAIGGQQMHHVLHLKPNPCLTVAPPIHLCTTNKHLQYTEKHLQLCGEQSSNPLLPYAFHCAHPVQHWQSGWVVHHT